MNWVPPQGHPIMESEDQLFILRVTSGRDKQGPNVPEL